MHGNLEWIETINKGDILGKDTWHPKNQWMLDIAPMEQWYIWWGGKSIFHQSPFYVYLTAFVKKYFVSEINNLRIFQHCIGIVTVVLIFFISLRLFSLQVAFISGLLSSLYFPFLCYEFYFLRDFLGVNLLCWLLFYIYLSKEKSCSIYFFITGLLYTLSFLTKENLLIMIIPIILILFWNKNFSLKNLLFLFSGIVIAFMPVLVRNYLTHAPLFSFSNRLIESLIEGNAFDSEPVFMCIAPSLSKYLHLANGRISDTLTIIIKDYPDWLSFFKFEFKKLFFNLFFYEPYNNINLYFFRDTFLFLKFLPDYAGILLFSLTGFFVSLKQKMNRSLILIFCVLLTSLMIAPVIDRYRLILIPVHIIFASVGLNFLFEKLPLKRGIIKILILCVFLLSFSLALNKFLPKSLTERDLENVYIEKIKLNQAAVSQDIGSL